MAILLFLASIGCGFIAFMFLMALFPRIAHGLDGGPAFKGFLSFAALAVIVWVGASFLNDHDNEKRAKAKAVSDAQAATQQAADDKKQAAADERQLKIDAPAAKAAGQSIELYQAVKEKGWGGYAGGQCRDRAIAAATYGWDPDLGADNGPSVVSAGPDSVTITGNDIRIKNGFGAEGQGKYTCSVDKKSGDVTLIDSGIDGGAN